MVHETNPQPIPSVWTRRERQSEQPALSRATIVREAVVMLDADGIEALSMRKLAARLNAGATSLYRHVATKDELMELAVDEVVAEVDVPAASSADWRTAAAGAASSFRATALRHPWLSSVLGQAGLAYLGPNLMSYSSRLAALFIDAGFEEPDRAIDTLFAYVVGMSTTETAWLTTVARSGETEAASSPASCPPRRRPPRPTTSWPRPTRQPRPRSGIRRPCATPSSPTASRPCSTAWPYASRPTRRPEVSRPEAATR